MPCAMKLFWSSRSPFVRKVMVAAHETGLVSGIECVQTVVAPAKPNAEVMALNPLNKLPTLLLDDGRVLYDSPVICEYLDGLHDGPKLFPSAGATRLDALRRQALGDGMMDFLLVWLSERSRPAEQQSPGADRGLPIETQNHPRCARNRGRCTWARTIRHRSRRHRLCAGIR